MKKYKDELDRFALSEEAKQKLKLAVRQQEEPKRRRPYLRYASALVAAVLVIVLVWPEKQANGIASILNGVMLDGTQYIKEYKPQSILNSGGFGAATGGEVSKKEEKPYLGVEEYSGERIAKEGITELPVYEKTAYTDFTPRNELTKDVQRTIGSNVCEKLNAKISSSESANSRLSIHFDHPLYDGLTVQEDGTSILRIKDSYTFTQTQDAKYVLTIAKEYTEAFLAPFGYTDPVYQLRLTKEKNYSVIITQSSDKQPLYQEGKAAVIMDFKSFGTTESSYLYQSNFSIPYEENIKELGDYSIMSEAEAKVILLHRGFYQYFNLGNFQKKDIVYCELIYVSESGFGPYIIPCYRFYIAIDDGYYPFTVIAIEQDELRTLNKIKWYMDKI